MSMTTTDSAAFRHALGRFATGVTIITTCDPQGQPCGVTASSFNSVSLDPPMVLWSLAKNSRSMEAFSTSDSFAVHVLGSDQEALSNRFASRGAEKFANLAWDAGANGIPLLPDCAARFLCKTVYRYEGGDHVIFVGEVLDFTRCEKAPLLFHAGKYAEAKQRVAESRAGLGIDADTGLMSIDFFLYLLPSAYFHATRPLRAGLVELGLGISESLSLTLVNNNGALSPAELARRLEHTGYAPSAQDVEAMRAKGWLQRDDGADDYRMTDAGRHLYLQVVTRMKAHEEWMLSYFASHEIADFKGLLARLIGVVAKDSPPPWQPLTPTPTSQINEEKKA